MTKLFSKLIHFPHFKHASSSEYLQQPSLPTILNRRISVQNFPSHFLRSFLIYRCYKLYMSFGLLLQTAVQNSCLSFVSKFPYLSYFTVFSHPNNIEQGTKIMDSHIMVLLQLSVSFPQRTKYYPYQHTVVKGQTLVYI